MPSRFFVTKRLELDCPRTRNVMEDEEPFAVDALDGFKLKRDRGGLAHGGKGDARTGVAVEGGWEDPAWLGGTILAMI